LGRDAVIISRINWLWFKKFIMIELILLEFFRIKVFFVEAI